MSAGNFTLNVLGESLTDCIILLISAVIFVCIGKDQKDNVKMGGAVCVLLYIVYTHLSDDQVK